MVPDQGKESCLLSYICLPTLVPVLDSVLSSTFFNKFGSYIFLPTLVPVLYSVLSSTFFLYVWILYLISIFDSYIETQLLITIFENNNNIKGIIKFEFYSTLNFDKQNNI